jgi:hypothetical protein
MEHMMVGRLWPEDQEAIDKQMAELQETSMDPYAQEPIQHHSHRVHLDTPMNAKVPAHLLPDKELLDTRVLVLHSSSSSSTAFDQETGEELHTHN